MLPTRTANLRSYYDSPGFITHFIRASKTVSQLKQTHTVLLKTLIKTHHYNHLLTRFLIQLLQFPGDNLCYACLLFDQIPHCKSQFLWTSLIRSHVFHDHFSRSLSIYARMHWVGVSPTGFTFSSVLNASARIPAISAGKQIHAKVLRSGFLGNKFVQTALLDVYAKSGFVSCARDLFDRMDDKDVVTWTAMICGYTKVGMMDEARLLFDNMGQRNEVSWTTMVAGYANYGDMKAARKLYDGMQEKNPVASVAMIAGYGKCGNVVESQKMFDEITVPGVSCWAAMVACYAQNGYATEAIEMYKKMKEENVKINEVAMVGAISACTQLSDIEMANILAKHMEEGCCNRTHFVSNAFIHMYSKFGRIDKARDEFNRMSDRDVISYSALLTALADHGKTQEALDVFSEMQKEGIKPNQVTFISVLNTCSHAGLIEEGCKYFKLMTEVYSIEPLNEHYACMVDLLGRAGQLEKAYNLIVGNVGNADATIWGALLSACKVHGNAELGEIAARHLFEIERDNTGNYVLLANTYASMNKWDDAERLRQMMREKDMRKIPGCSWI
ncbi:hypothetical protein F2P56_016316 [Juglans regia]|uniref:Pentatricopeptide repeat-containing protein At5g37570 n=2 Tax=Juglans regia TaxID=51240 RepID=A0A2I4FTW9_JUGRE|nr:putative pentatricopeptide repeat-containing protein At5g37570 [Juglans regia]KAF5466390.1 hypothetical protein F2P56_016316 [Juglans regia]